MHCFKVNFCHCKREVKIANPPLFFPSRICVCCHTYNNEINETGRWYISTKRRHFKNNTFRGKRQRNFRSVISLLGLFVRFECEILNSIYLIKEVFSFQMIRKNALCSVALQKMHCRMMVNGWNCVEIYISLLCNTFREIYIWFVKAISEKNLVIITSSGELKQLTRW